MNPRCLLAFVALLLFNVPAQAQVVGTPTTIVKSSATESGKVLKAADGFLYGMSVTTGAAAGYLMVFNSTTVPADGAVTPVHCYYVGSYQTLGVNFNQYPSPFSTGISLAFSTTGCFTKTASATAFFTAQVR